MKAEEDAKDEAYDAFIGAASRWSRRHRAFQADSNLSTSASSKSDSDLEELDSFDDSDSGDDKGEEEEEDEDIAPDYPHEDFDFEVDKDAYNPCSSYVVCLQTYSPFFFLIGRPYYWP